VYHETVDADAGRWLLAWIELAVLEQVNMFETIAVEVDI
jgi:hypothetical protein